MAARRAGAGASPRRSPTQPRATVTVDAMLTAVELVLEKHGPAGLTTNRVAEIAGVSVGSLYQYFPNKEAMVSTVLERYVGRFIGPCREVVAGSHAYPTDVVVNQVAAALVSGYTALRPIHRWLIELRSAAAFQDRFHRALDVLVEEIATALAKRTDVRVANPHATAFVLVHGVTGIVEAAGARSAEVDVMAIGAEAARMIRTLLAASQ